jgi:hypothetical protein
MMTNSQGWKITARWPPIPAKPPSIQPSATNVPIRNAKAYLVPAANLTEVIRREALLQAEFGCDIKGERWPER